MSRDPPKSDDPQKAKSSSRHLQLHPFNNRIGYHLKSFSESLTSPSAVSPLGEAPPCEVLKIAPIRDRLVMAIPIRTVCLLQVVRLKVT